MATNTIHFGTNRVVLSEGADGTAAFGNAHNAEKPFHFRVGRVEVTRQGHPWRDGGSTYRAGMPRLYPETPPSPEAPEGQPGSRALFDDLRARMRESPRDVLVFIHGFANTFASAMEHAAELRDAYLSPMSDPETGELATRGREPLVFAFAWPSDGKLFLDDRTRWAYSGDREDARVSGLAMARAALKLFDYLAGLAEEERCQQRLHLVAHSMGNWTLRHAVQGLVEIAEAEGRGLQRVFDNVFLMASDIEADALEKPSWLGPLFDLARRVHVYHAENDRALGLSEVKPNQGARLGHFGPTRMASLPDRVTAIDCALVSRTPADGPVRHQYHRLAPEVLRDVRAVLASKPPEEMPGRIPLDGPRRFRLKLDKAARDALDRG